MQEARGGEDHEREVSDRTALIQTAVLSTAPTSAAYCSPNRIWAFAILCDWRKPLSPLRSGSTALSRIVRPWWRNRKPAAACLWNVHRVIEASVESATYHGMKTRRAASNVRKSCRIRNFENSPSGRNGSSARSVVEWLSSRQAATWYFVCKNLDTLIFLSFCYHMLVWSTHIRLRNCFKCCDLAIVFSLQMRQQVLLSLWKELAWQGPGRGRTL